MILYFITGQFIDTHLYWTYIIIFTSLLGNTNIVFITIILLWLPDHVTIPEVLLFSMSIYMVPYNCIEYCKTAMNAPIDLELLL